jgi:hypothetical protein
LRGDSEQSPIEALKLAPDFLIAELAAAHLQEMAGGGEGLPDSGKIGGGGGVGNGEGRRAMRLSRILAGSVELALQVLLRDLDIAQGHADILVPQ